jgi:hypothetical protein
MHIGRTFAQRLHRPRENSWTDATLKLLAGMGIGVNRHASKVTYDDADTGLIVNDDNARFNTTGLAIAYPGEGITFPHARRVLKIANRPA